MIEIDGSQGEGGGQIFRTAITLSCITQQPFRTYNIRANRPQTGLKPQHLASLAAAAKYCDAEISGNVVGSSHVTFQPNKLAKPGSYEESISQLTGQSSAGSTILLLQTLYPLFLTQKPSTITLSGGTHVQHSPSADFFSQIYLPMVRRLGVKAEFEIDSLGFYPRGGGKITLSELHGGFKPINFLEKGTVNKVTAIFSFANLPNHIAGRGANYLKENIKPFNIELIENQINGNSPGIALLVKVETEHLTVGFDALGERGKPIESVVDEALYEFHKWRQAEGAIDQHLADQLVLPLALASGNTKYTVIEITQHLLTVIEIVKMFLPVKIELSGTLGSPGTVTISS